MTTPTTTLMLVAPSFSSTDDVVVARDLDSRSVVASEGAALNDVVVGGDGEASSSESVEVNVSYRVVGRSDQVVLRAGRDRNAVAGIAEIQSSGDVGADQVSGDNVRVCSRAGDGNP